MTVSRADTVVRSAVSLPLMWGAKEVKSTSTLGGIPPPTGFATPVLALPTALVKGFPTPLPPPPSFGEPMGAAALAVVVVMVVVEHVSIAWRTAAEKAAQARTLGGGVLPQAL